MLRFVLIVAIAAFTSSNGNGTDLRNENGARTGILLEYLWDDVSAVEQTDGHVLAVTRIAFHHLVRLKNKCKTSIK